MRAYRIRVLFGLVLSMAIGAAANASVLFQDDFQSDVAGTFPDCQSTTLHPVIGAGDVGGSWTVSDNRNTGTGLQVWNNADPNLGGYPNCVAGSNNYVKMSRYNDGSEGYLWAGGWDASATANQQIELKFSLFKPTGHPPTAFIGGFADQDYNGRSFSIYVRSAGNIDYYDGGDWHDTGVSVALDTWQNMTLKANMQSHTYTLTVGNTTSGLLNWTGDASSVSCLNFANTAAYDGSFCLDNVQLSAVPEPTTASLLGVGCMALAAYAWRKRR